MSLVSGADVICGSRYSETQRQPVFQLIRAMVDGCLIVDSGVEKVELGRCLGFRVSLLVF